MRTYRKQTSPCLIGRDKGNTNDVQSDEDVQDEIHSVQTVQVGSIALLDLVLHARNRLSLIPSRHHHNNRTDQRNHQEHEGQVDDRRVLSQIRRSPTHHSPPTPPLFHATDRQRGSHSNQHVEHGRYASALPRSPTSEHTAHRHLRVALNSETHVSDDVTQRVAPGKDGEA